MDNSLLVSLSQQVASYRSMDVIANNLANVSTPGFKRQSAKFEQYVEQAAPGSGESGSQSVSFVKDAGISRDISQGAIQSTGGQFDFAINGNGFFQVQTAAGIRYTRDGHFTLDPNGQVVDSNGNALLGDGGAITVTPADGDIAVGADGTLSSTALGKTTELGKLKLVDFADDHTLVEQGASLYSTDQAPNAAPKATITQGALEASNVQPVLEISHMIEVMRAYQATATMTQSQEQLSSQAIDKLGTMPN